MDIGKLTCAHQARQNRAAQVDAFRIASSKGFDPRKSRQPFGEGTMISGGGMVAVAAVAVAGGTRQSSRCASG